MCIIIWRIIKTDIFIYLRNITCFICNKMSLFYITLKTVKTKLRIGRLPGPLAICIGSVAATGTASPHHALRDKSPHILARGSAARETCSGRAAVFQDTLRGLARGPQQLDLLRGTPIIHRCQTGPENTGGGGTQCNSVL